MAKVNKAARVFVAMTEFSQCMKCDRPDGRKWRYVALGETRRESRSYCLACAMSVIDKLWVICEDEVMRRKGFLEGHIRHPDYYE